MSWDFIFLHKANEFGDGDSSIFAAGDSVAVEELFVEPFADGPACYVTDFRHFACRQDIFALCHNLHLSKKRTWLTVAGQNEKEHRRDHAQFRPDRSLAGRESRRCSFYSNLRSARRLVQNKANGAPCLNKEHRAFETFLQCQTVGLN